MAKHPRHIVITGASGGLGSALALSYAEPGNVLGLTGRKQNKLEEIATLCRRQGAIVLSYPLDTQDAQSVSDWLDQFDQQYPIDLLIANAGVASTLSSSQDWEDEQTTRHVVDTNFYGTLNTVLPVINRMRSRQNGQIALVSSLAALRGMAISPAYCASKAAIMAWGDSVRPLLQQQGIVLSMIYPGFVKTGMSDVFPGDKPFIWSAARAARHIRRQLNSQRREIAFPALLAFGTRHLPLLPARVADWILDKLSYLPKGR